MKEDIRRRLRVSPALIVAMLALFVALTGTAVSASSLITGKQIKNSSITGLDVKNKSLTPKDFKGSVRGPRGLTGPKGDKGDKGDPGAPNPNAVNSDKLDNLDSTDFQKVPTVPQHLVIPGTTVTDQDGTGRVEAFYNEAGGTGVQWCTKTGGGGAGWDAMPVNLPQGAVIQSFRLDYGDDAASAAGNGIAFLTRMSLAGSGSSYSDLFTVTPTNTATAGALGSVIDTTVSNAANAVVDNSKHAYTVLLGPAAGAAVCSVDITYTVSPGFAAAGIDRGGSTSEASSKSK